MSEDHNEHRWQWLKQSQVWLLYWINRLPTALEVIVIVILIRLFEASSIGHSFLQWLGIHSFLDIIESISILVAVFIYFKEAPERQKRSHYEAWQVVDAAHGKKNSYARIQALQDLNEDEISLSGLELPHANLQGIRLRRADLLGADLKSTNFLEADLYRAELRSTFLQKSNLQRANLKGADLRGANLEDANLLGADLQGANLKGANLRRAKLRAVNLRDTNLMGANLQDADLRIAENLTIEQLQCAQNWEFAIYDDPLQALLTPHPTPDVSAAEPASDTLLNPRSAHPPLQNP
jgi:hypothetical protein